MAKNYLVTGGLGFIGSTLVDALIAKGNKVFIIDNLSSGSKNNSNVNAEYIYKDLTKYIEQPNYLVDILVKNNIDTVFHLAANASVTLSFQSPERVYEINLLSSICLINCCEKANIKKILFPSTSAVYGEPQFLPVDESHPTNPISPYGLSKLAFEQYARSFVKLNNIDILIFRLPNVYGLRQRSDLEGGVVSIFHNLIKLNKTVTIYGDGNQTRDWVHVDDIVRAFCLGVESKSKEELVSLGSGVETSLNQLFTDLLKIYTDYSKQPIYAEPRQGEISRMVMENNSAKKIIGWVPEIDLLNGLLKLN